jgi:transcriptional regulator GlxA family with amidase domain
VTRKVVVLAFPGPEPIFVHSSERVWTAAGVTAGIDLALWLVEDDHGTEAARRQLEETADTVGAIAARCGFGTAETMRRNFVRRFGVSPDQYRRTFAQQRRTA